MSNLGAVEQRLARIEQALEDQATNVERFWSTTWPNVEQRLEDHEHRIRTLERIMTQIPSLEEKMDRLASSLEIEATKVVDLEKWRIRALAYLAGGAAVAGAVSGMVVWFIERVVLS